MTSIFRLATVPAVTAMMGIELPAPARAAVFQPLNSPATKEHHPGKFVWADDPWVDGQPWYGEPQVNASVGFYIHPPRQRR
jgi:hypothetical protein